MEFKDRLKEELDYHGWIVKELSAKTGVGKRTLDTYFDSRAAVPSADIAVRIAKALGVTVEYLVTGETAGNEVLAPDVRKIIEKLQVLDAQDRRAVETLIDSLSQRYLKCIREGCISLIARGW